MFLFLRLRSETKAIGKVAAYCPVCRDICAFQCFLRIDSIHLQGVIPISDEPDYSCLPMICQSCRISLVDRDSNFLEIVKEEISLEELIKLSNPRVHIRHEYELKVGRKLREGNASPKERQDVLRDGLKLISDTLPRNVAEVGIMLGFNSPIQSRSDIRQSGKRPLGLWFAIAIGLGMSCIVEIYVSWCLYGDGRKLLEYTPYFMAGGITTGLLFTIFLNRLSHMGKPATDSQDTQLNSILRKMFSDMRPTLEELRMALDELREKNWTVAHHYTPEQLFEILKPTI